MPRIITLADIENEIGSEYISRWFEIPQQRINQFAR